MRERPGRADSGTPVTRIPHGRRLLRRDVAAALAGLVLAACATGGSGTGVGSIEPRGGRSGLQLTGTIDGAQVAVNDGAPVLRLGDCDVNDGVDTDLCFFSRTLAGEFFAIVMENPDAVIVGTAAVVTPPCVSPHCDDIADGVIAELQYAPGAPRVRATGGSITFDVVDEGRRYSGTMNLQLPDGRVGGTFEVVPRPEEPEA